MISTNSHSMETIVCFSHGIGLLIAEHGVYGDVSIASSTWLILKYTFETTAFWILLTLITHSCDVFFIERSLPPQTPAIDK